MATALSALPTRIAHQMKARRHARRRCRREKRRTWSAVGRVQHTFSTAGSWRKVAASVLSKPSRWGASAASTRKCGRPTVLAGRTAVSDTA